MMESYYYRKSFNLYQEAILKMQCLAIGGAVSRNKKENELAKKIIEESDALLINLKNLLDECFPTENAKG